MYIGRSKVRRGHPFVQTGNEMCEIAQQWESKIRHQSVTKADAFKHYVVAMDRCLTAIAKRLRSRKLAIFVVGKNSWNGRTIPTDRLISELAEKKYDVVDRFWYPVKNRYMSYSSQNGASIDRDHVLVLERR